MIRLTQHLLLLGALVMFSCQSATQQTQVAPVETPQPAALATVTSYQIGDQVPSDLVCMVNNAYMAKKQFEVPFEGKTYYGCCSMCVERIPQDKAARTAIDPFTSKEIDKSEAYIVLVSGEGHVAYFENEQNYKRFLAEQ